MEPLSIGSVSSPFQSSTSNESYGTISTFKFNSLVRQNHLKKLRRDLILLMNYIYSISPSFKVIHKIMSFFRILQFLFPCLIPAYSNVWENGSIDKTVINVLSVFNYLIPSTSFFDGVIILLIVYVIIQFIVIVIVFCSSIYFKRYAKLPTIIPPFISFYHAIFGHYFHPIILYSIFQCISYFAKYSNDGRINLTAFIVLSVLSAICMTFNFFFMMIINCQTLIFYPNSLPSAIPPPQILLMLDTLFINVFFGLGVFLDQIPQTICLLVPIFFYVMNIVSAFQYGGYIQKITTNMVISSSVTGIVFSITNVVLVSIGRYSSLIYFFAFIIFFVIIFLANNFVTSGEDMKQLKILDLIESDKSYFGYIKTPNNFLLLAVTGIRYAHPIIADLSYFSMGIDKWNKNTNIYLLYAKFVAIFPEDITTLKYIYKHVMVQKLAGYQIRCIKEQTKRILKLRDSGLSPELRNKINKLRKENQSTKHKLSHVWDVVIRRNINEIEIATKRALNAMSETDADFKHLLREFPNNRNVTHFYAIFLNEVMADFTLAKEMREKTKLLQPGVTLLNDQAHELGIRMFPNLPTMVKSNKEPVVSTFENGHVPLSTDLERDYKDELYQLAGIKNNINELSIPSIKGSKILELFSMIVLFIFPCIFGLVYTDICIDRLTEPLEFIGSLSMLRTLTYQVTGFSLRYVGESLGFLPKIADIQTLNPPVSLGGTWDTKKQLQYLLNKTTISLQEFGSFQKFEENNVYINQARDLIFQNTVNYDYYKSSTNVTSSNISIQGAILDFTIQQKTILSSEKIDANILDSGSILNPINNALPIVTNINFALDLMIEFIRDNYGKTQKITKILLIVLIIVEIVLNISIILIESKWINYNKQETYQCLFSLPKNIVSELAENKESKKKDNQNEEMNKQDENILKVFNSGTSGDDTLSDISLMVMGTTLIAAVEIVCIVLFVLIVSDATRIIRDSAPHLNYLQGAYAMLASAVNWLNMIVYDDSGYKIPTSSYNHSLDRIQFTLQSSRDFYHLICCGGPSIDQVPFKKFNEGVRRATALSAVNCQNSNSSTNNTLLQDFSFSNFHSMHPSDLLKSSFLNMPEALECSPVDMIYVVMEPIILYSLSPYTIHKLKSLQQVIDTYSAIWIKVISPLYDLFFEPLHNMITPTIIDELNQKKNLFIPIIIVFLFIGIIADIILLVQVFWNERHIKSVLGLLLHCNPSIIYNSPKIMCVLSGNFSQMQSDSLSNNDFFDTVFTNLPDAIMYANSDMIIQNANNACKHVFDNVDLVGKSIKSFFMSDRFSGNVMSLFSSVNLNITEEITYKSENNSDTILSATSMIAGGKFVVSCRNVTQSHRYNTLIYEEKQNSDKLLKTILPPSLVTRVQEGETNISFSVQSATILFSDIVSFTPWCGSLPAETVMSTLNILFKRFDSILDTKETMTKIKCIGDCYMAAGGIFAEINQPTLHAKEVVAFGVQSIKEITQINKEINQNLKIRVGVNTGGPIVAGVLGIGKPTFEILGPAINRAQQMEQNGMQMMVHISTETYNLICGLNFKICNRREIEIKNEVVETYLVEP